MSNDYLNTAYKARVLHLGSTDKEKIVNGGIRSFERYLARAATKQTITLNNEKITVSIQDSRQDVLGQRYEKLILAPLDSNLDVGDVFEWENSDWIMLTKYSLSIKTHIKGNIRKCEHTLKWYSGEELLETTAHIINNRGVGESESTSLGIVSTDPSLVIVAIVPSDEDTLTIKRGHRFIIDGQAWKVSSIDDTSAKKLRIITMKEDVIDMSRDKIGEDVADAYITDDTGKVVVDEVEYSIEGSSTISWGQSAEYVAKIDNELAEDIEFVISNLDLATFVTDHTDNPVELIANTEGIVGEFNLTVEFTESIVVNKIIKVVSLWG